MYERRQGQTEKVIVHHIVVEGGVGEDLMAALQDEGATHDRLMNALKARIEKYSATHVAVASCSSEKSKYLGNYTIDV